MKKMSFLVLILFPLVVFSQNSIQWNDDFSDGDFTQNPTWSGVTGNFIVNADNQLQSNATVAARSYLSTPSEVFDDAVWEFWVKINYNPTSSNYSMVYLTSDRENVSGDVNGYYVQIGNTAKEISLYRQQGNTRAKIIDGVDGILNATAVEAQIRVMRTKDGVFSLYRKLPSDADWVQEGAATTDNNVKGSQYFGVLVVNSSLTGKAYFFDNISVKGDKFQDIISPEWLDVRIVEPDKLSLTFSEAIDISASNFIVDNGMGNPLTKQVSADGMTVTLNFAKSFEKGKIYTVDALNVKDIAGNLLQNTRKMVGIIEQTIKGDLVINEILFDNPDFAPEYFEVYNNSSKLIDLNRVFFAVRNAAGRFTANTFFPPNTFLLPNSYLALTSDPELVRIGYSAPETANIQKAERWTALNNTSANFLIGRISGSDTIVLDEVRYDVKWQDPKLSNTKGVSLERIFPDKPAQNSFNWHSASSEVRYGTPGYQNSQYQKIVDNTPPDWVSLYVVEPNQLVINLTEAVDISTATFQVDNDMGAPNSTVISANLTSIRLTFTKSFERGKIYTLEAANIHDFSGNLLRTSSKKFGIAESAEGNELVINEILFNNPDFAPEYFELYNLSSKILDLSRIFYATGSTSGNFIPSHFFPPNSYILPDSYLALTSDPELVRNGFSAPDTAQIIKSDSWVSLSNSGANFFIGTLIDTKTVIMDSVTYDAKWHHSLIRNPKGVSLEKLNPRMPSQSPDSWHSASSEVNYGTPGYQNSQFRELLAQSISGEKWFRPDPEAFTPDNDGIDDVCFIRYQTDAAGFTANVIIFNPVGVKVRQLASNQVLGAEGYLIWDGKTDRGINANPGIYVLYVELVNNVSGVKKIEKMPIVVSAR